MMNRRFLALIFSLGITVSLVIIMVLLYAYLQSGSGTDRTMIRFLVLLGADYPFGLIQTFTFFLFFYALIELIQIYRYYNTEQLALEKGYLPEKENWILSPADVMQLKLDIQNKAKYKKYLLFDTINTVCTRFRANKSASESLEVLSARIKNYRENEESDQSVIRYILWAIPSVGFIGTVIGIARSLGAVKQNMTGEDLSYVTSALNLAFDTTLLALLLSLVLMFVYYRVHEKTEKLFSKTEKYVLENLINRIYNS